MDRGLRDDARACHMMPDTSLNATGSFVTGEALWRRVLITKERFARGFAADANRKVSKLEPPVNEPSPAAVIRRASKEKRRALQVRARRLCMHHAMTFIVC